MGYTSHGHVFVMICTCYRESNNFFQWLILVTKDAYKRRKAVVTYALIIFIIMFLFRFQSHMYVINEDNLFYFILYIENQNLIKLVFSLIWYFTDIKCHWHQKSLVTDISLYLHCRFWITSDVSIYLTSFNVSHFRNSNACIEDIQVICFFEVNTKYISLSELKTSEF